MIFEAFSVCTDPKDSICQGVWNVFADVSVVLLFFPFLLILLVLLVFPGREAYPRPHGTRAHIQGVFFIGAFIRSELEKESI